ncbi:anthocyanidin 3-O-glucosyltransferase 1-like [Jatropha curcas]|uniref:anthocyanidin 3-O-glucosyltransferase 1-like n=1 Tax=Jatropha curcas TaxID=180498 RepID=UPI00189372B7|nr:anthocyanidin 3-O-glucosyltransferase 1-like [Jatropha curcas]
MAIPEGVNHLQIDHAVKVPFPQTVTRTTSELPYNFERRIEEVLADTERTTGSRREVTCIMTDAAICSPLGKMAEDMNVPWIAFMLAPPNDLLCFFEMDKIQKLFANAKSENDNVDVIPGLSSLPFKDLPHEIHLSKPSNEIVPYLYRMAQKLPQAKALLLNTYEELNPIPLTNYLKSKENDGSSTSTGCLFSWLDRQKVSSVVYISFGTVVELGSEELMALAEAIEYSARERLISSQTDESEAESRIDEVEAVGGEKKRKVYGIGSQTSQLYCGSAAHAFTVSAGPQPEHTAEQFTKLWASVDDQQRQIAELRAHVMQLSDRNVSTSQQQPLLTSDPDAADYTLVTPPGTTAHPADTSPDDPTSDRADEQPRRFDFGPF